MRIQHNIAAMSSYRNYTNNTSAVAKNLEKLSSGYRINRAGDDAAGLAISEKMRAQITGLEAAQKNAKDGISLVKTAEGALQEVHDMLNRMVNLATQSANGTYDNETDRAQLQKEVDQLKEEINRIADSANFNGIKLLDGSLNAEKTTIAGQANILLGTAKTGDFNVQSVGSSASATTTVLHKDAAGAGQTTFEVSLNGLSLQATSTTVGASIAITVGGTKLTMAAKTGKEEITAADLAAGLADTYKGKSVTINGVLYKVEASDDKLKFTMEKTSAQAATAQASFSGNFTVTVGMGGNVTTGKLTNNGNIVRATTNIVEGSPNSGTILANTTQATGWGANDIKDGMVLKVGNESYIFALSDKTFENASAVANTAQADGQVYKVVDLRDLADPTSSTPKLGTAAASGTSATIAVSNALTRLTEVAKDNEMFSVGLNTDAASPKLTFQEKDTYSGDARLDLLSDSTNAKGAMGKCLSDQFAVYENVKFDVTTPTTSVEGKALTLQIGDTSESFNQLKVSIKDCHVSSLGIAGVNIGSQEGASAAIDKIKAAINTVSDVRGTLGATQNRLDHTINNLSVMRENIQDAESTIRDTDIAEEMMAYTKNNILVQSAQAMLAQANQIPQGVLQLLG